MAIFEGNVDTHRAELALAAALELALNALPHLRHEIDLLLKELTGRFPQLPAEEFKQQSTVCQCQILLFLHMLHILCGAGEFSVSARFLAWIGNPCRMLRLDLMILVQRYLHFCCRLSHESADSWTGAAFCVFLPRSQPAREWWGPMRAALQSADMWGFFVDEYLLPKGEEDADANGFKAKDVLRSAELRMQQSEVMEAWPMPDYSIFGCPTTRWHRWTTRCRARGSCSYTVPPSVRMCRGARTMECGLDNQLAILSLGGSAGDRVALQINLQALGCMFLSRLQPANVMHPHLRGPVEFHTGVLLAKQLDLWARSCAAVALTSRADQAPATGWRSDPAPLSKPEA